MDTKAASWEEALKNTLAQNQEWSCMRASSPIYYSGSFGAMRGYDDALLEYIKASPEQNIKTLMKTGLGSIGKEYCSSSDGYIFYFLFCYPEIKKHKGVIYGEFEVDLPFKTKPILNSDVSTEGYEAVAFGNRFNGGDKYYPNNGQKPCLAIGGDYYECNFKPGSINGYGCGFAGGMQVMHKSIAQKHYPMLENSIGFA